ncbi:MAG: tetratricopeptide repeat protein [Planctomycetes bacterium]|nr:tetratricopeptide repeat protein [Planctomycetota bacterium]
MERRGDGAKLFFSAWFFACVVVVVVEFLCSAFRRVASSLTTENARGRTMKIALIALCLVVVVLGAGCGTAAPTFRAVNPLFERFIAEVNKAKEGSRSGAPWELWPEGDNKRMPGYIVRVGPGDRIVTAQLADESAGSSASLFKTNDLGEIYFEVKSVGDADVNLAMGQRLGISGKMASVGKVVYHLVGLKRHEISEEAFRDAFVKLPPDKLARYKKELEGLATYAAVIGVDKVKVELFGHDEQKIDLASLSPAVRAGAAQVDGGMLVFAGGEINFGYQLVNLSEVLWDIFAETNTLQLQLKDANAALAASETEKQRVNALLDAARTEKNDLQEKNRQLGEEIVNAEDAKRNAEQQKSAADAARVKASNERNEREQENGSLRQQLNAALNAQAQAETDKDTETARAEKQKMDFDALQARHDSVVMDKTNQESIIATFRASDLKKDQTIASLKTTIEENKAANKEDKATIKKNEELIKKQEDDISNVDKLRQAAEAALTLAVRERDTAVSEQHKLDLQELEAAKEKLNQELKTAKDSCDALTKDKSNLQEQMTKQNQAADAAAKAAKLELGTAQAATTKAENATTLAENTAKEKSELLREKKSLAAKLQLALGLIEAKNGNFDGAITIYTDALGEDADFSDAFIARANAHRDQKNLKRDLSRAIKDYDKALEVDPKKVPAYTARGQTHLEMGEYQKAVDDLDAALKHGHDAELYYLRGDAKSKLAGTLSDTAATKRDKTLDSANYDYTVALFMYGMSEEGKSLAEEGKVLTMDPGVKINYPNGFTLDQGNHQKIAAIYFARGIGKMKMVKDDKQEQYYSAEADFNSALKKDPKHYVALHYLGVVEKKLDKTTAGEAHCDEAKKIAPEGWIPPPDLGDGGGPPPAPVEPASTPPSQPSRQDESKKGGAK